MSATTCKLLLKSMPCTMSEFAQLIQELKLIVPRSLNAFGRRRVLLEYSDATEAQAALEQLLGLSNILDKPLRVSCFGHGTETQHKPKTCNKSTQAVTAVGTDQTLPQAEINKYVQKLYACNNQCDFTQPPPPYLRYAYPPINVDILAAIGHALTTDKRFYTQVLHLMNRMNLTPPFGQQPAGLNLPPKQTQLPSVATQTELLSSETESELESDDEHNKHVKVQQQTTKRTATSVISQQYRKRARQMLQLAASQVASKATAPSQKTDEPTFVKPKIELKLPAVLPTAATEQLPSERLAVEQLQELPVYRNYQMGVPSNKLYIKNLDKSVLETQLRTLYARYTPADDLEIKLMQQGRMKGQAFVTFLQAETAVVATALAETNGLLWQQKPMIVCYGKQQQHHEQQAETKN